VIKRQQVWQKKNGKQNQAKTNLDEKVFGKKRFCENTSTSWAYNHDVKDVY